MAEAQKIPFLKLFSAWRPGPELTAMVQGYLVTRAVIDKHTRSIKAQVECTALPAEELRRQIERSIPGGAGKAGTVRSFGRRFRSGRPSGAGSASPCPAAADPAGGG